MAVVRTNGRSVRVVPPQAEPKKPRAVYVYLVEYTVPPDKQWPWVPEDYRGDPDDWHWPNKKRCLTYNTASRWANHMETLGAVDVRIRRSKPVEWED